ncbi:putative dehydrogenase [Pontibacter ummariensis]|uniref:Predicted dehydrogenase n=1 Tax=Pontibacter ummariensis TaxID=1610492 RepID=A0A239BS63_9BACT|nr:Gfo/Idh/MocA family oxidoreductase [Pontibacter ummariensis]PRY15688.1 putative dehydrogenase [Pontibacter ummariensis]SNS09983.1 Predicted dehydrogenase [Pontibacter ummariensis]
MKEKELPQSRNRRRFIKGITCALGTAALGAPLLSYGESLAGTRKPQNKKLGIALVGLGNYSTNQLAPALQETEKCYLAGVVTGSPPKAEEWKKKYSIPGRNIYSYDTYDQIKDNPDIDIIYVVLPNAMHAEYTIRAAEAGKHVICEKPMATSEEDCARMIEACKRNNRKLSVGYRLHFEPHNQRVMELGQQQVFGKVKKIDGAHSFVVSNDPDRWRLNKKLSGGGPLMDVGIYCVQAACYTTGETPVAVTAKFGEVTRPVYFDEVEQSVSWQLEFPGGAVANGSSSYNENKNFLYGEAEEGWWRLQPAYSYSGIEGRTSKGPMNYPQVNQQARQMDAFAECVLENRESRVPGEMGMRDVRILMAIYEAARTGKRVLI